ncbi:MAG: CopG-like protein DNA-binding protein [uncultured bacterium]|nr:MAG: CopG-like protein DNA-binding protein [uncultured bacterium]OGT15189.1 MAG: CopG family transcriptional regulator [Gammaproteobacteria bacterium RIFCSPHIGHO2_02_FULL_38_33]OGT24321.1 MAG: CopG family transcriptional regulator [Gammaproteobacteria bacterium RIFCSPHIGHO2_12_38_15]OGT77466.1 MAG: CopG family transcriptional regulator [Gammaproteobacteria bacterium RIFCSPLOWO2_12_FULL_38_14]
MLAIRIEKPLIKALDLLAKEKHTNRSVIIRNAIIHYLEDIEDLGLAKLAQKKMKTTKSLLQIRKELGLDS